MVNEHAYNQEKEQEEQILPIDEQDQEATPEQAGKEADGESEPDPGNDLAGKLEEAKDKYARLLAEFENYKRRTSREKIEIIQSAGKEVISKLLPVLDDMDRALASTEQAQDIQAVKEGVQLVNHKFHKILDQQGLKAMEVLGKPFDSELQEAITSIPAPTEDMKNKVIDVVEKGYLLNGKVIRFAKVVIGQ